MDLKRFLFIEIFLLGLLFPRPACADTINLLNGNTIEGKITEQTDKYVKIETAGVSLTYYSDEIRSINRGNSLGNSQRESSQTEFFKPGKWAMTVTSSMGGGMPEMDKVMNSMSPQMQEQMKAEVIENVKKKDPDAEVEIQDFNPRHSVMTITKCYKRTDTIPYNMMNNGICHEDHVKEGNIYHFTETCNVGGVAVTGTGYWINNGDSYESEITSEMNVMNQHMNGTVHSSGEYLGPC